MSNMSYCMFENTYKDLQQVYGEGDWDSNSLSEREQGYRERLIKLCKEISDNYSDEEEQ